MISIWKKLNLHPPKDTFEIMVVIYLNTGDEDNIKKIKQYLQDSCHSRALTCLICIASVKHIDAVSFFFSNFFIINSLQIINQ
jgi:hypothetical protein